MKQVGNVEVPQKAFLLYNFAYFFCNITIQGGGCPVSGRYSVVFIVLLFQNKFIKK
jgi:hypothetical protein